jgi:sulfatase modifying factor 1
MRLSRRTFLALSSASLIAHGQRTAPAAQARLPFRGTRPGDERTIEGLRLRWCPPGRFRMGSPSTERGRRPDETPIDVTLTRGFWTGAFEVTQGEWRRVVGAFPERLPSPAFGEGDDFPMYWINFDQAETFCRTLTARAHRSGGLPDTWTFSLPTEAQWEYACRAGTTTASAFGDTLGLQHANFDAEADTRTTRLTGGSRRVGSYPANSWGLHDMHGNVWEWCRDYYHAQLPGGTDPDLSDRPGVQNGDGTYSRVRRGGAWIESDAFSRSACRLRYEAHRGSDHIGFRVVVVERG